MTRRLGTLLEGSVFLCDEFQHSCVLFQITKNSAQGTLLDKDIRIYYFNSGPVLVHDPGSRAHFLLKLTKSLG